MSETAYRFGLFELDTEPPELRREGVRLSLQQLPLRLLGALVENAGEVVSREELRHRLWPADVHVDFDNSLNAAMSRLREALGDTAANPRFIATEPRRGFRFIAPVECLSLGGASADVPPASPPSRRRLLLLRAPLMLVAGTLAIIAGFGVLWSTRSPRERASRGSKALLAVLPFRDLSPSPDRGYLSEGLTEELISRLGSASPRRLGVVARSSVMSYKDQPIDRVASSLHVQYVVEGSVRREGDSTRIAVRLIATSDQATLWSESYDASFANALSLQADVAAKVVAALETELLGPAARDAAASQPRLPRGQELYLRGRYLLNRQTPEALAGALAAFKEATTLDPRDAGAYRGLAETYLGLGKLDVWPPARAFPSAAAAARAAQRLDPGSAELQLVLAEQHFYVERDLARAERELVGVVRLNPSLSRAHAAYAKLLSASGRHDEAVAAVQEALRLDPLSLATNVDLCWTHFVARHYQQAVSQCQATLELDPHFLPAQDDLKWIFTRMGRRAEAADAFLRVVALEGESADSIVGLRGIFSREGMDGLHRASLRGLRQRAKTRYQAPYDLALEYAALGDRAAALEWLERSADANETDLVWLGVDPRLDPVRDDERFGRLLARVGLPPGERGVGIPAVQR